MNECVMDDKLERGGQRRKGREWKEAKKKKNPNFIP